MALFRPACIGIVAFALGCAPAAEPLPEVVPDGKADNFYSLTAQEFVVEGTTTVTLESSYAGATETERDDRAKELVGLKQVSIAWFLTQFLIAKEHDDPNIEFGGMGGLARGGAFEDLGIHAIDELTYEFTFQQIIAAKPELLRSLDLSLGPDNRPTFELYIGNPTNEEMGRLETNAEWYRSAPWSGWNPDDASDGQKELMTLTIEEEVASFDAWFDFESLFEDGQLTIDVHFGWDYHNAFHVLHANALFDHLKDQGYTMPVDSFEKLDRTSGAMTTTLRANGKQVDVAIRIFYGMTGTDNDPDTAAGGIVLEEDMRDSLRKSDIIIYSGHSGPFYGFALANWKVTDEGDFDDSEMAGADMPDDRYQIVFAEGCDTYQIGEAFRQNPAKLGLVGLDVITTTQASNASTPDAVLDFIARLTEVNDDDTHDPRTIKSLLTDLDTNSSWFRTMYGIHGIDDNPQIHPYAEPNNLCQTCSDDSDCGGVGNTCVNLGHGGVCTAGCTTDDACPANYTCADFATSGVMGNTGCIPATRTCQ